MGAVILACAAVLASAHESWSGTIYVAPNGNDSAAGTLQAPLLTVQAGINKAQAGDTVHVEPGLYRERLTFPNNGAAGAPITLQGDGMGDTILDGGTILTGWQKVAVAGNVWRAAYTGPQPRNLTWNNKYILGINLALMGQPEGNNILSEGPQSWDTYDGTLYRSWDGIEAMWGPLNGYVYIGFGDSIVDPTTQLITIAPLETDGGSVITLDGNKFINVTGFTIRNGYHAVLTRNSSSDCIISNNFLIGGHEEVEIRQQSSRITVTNNQITMGYIHTFSPTDPRHWFIWGVCKLGANDAGLFDDDHDCVELENAAADCVVSYNHMYENFDGIMNQNGPTTGLIVSYNLIEHCTDDALEPDGDETGAQWHDNTVNDANIAFRHKNITGPGPMYVYRNMLYSAASQPSHNGPTEGLYYFSGVTTPAYIYQNTFVYCLGAQLGNTNQQIGLPNEWDVNNIFSCSQQDFGQYAVWTPNPHIAYNYWGGDLSAPLAWWLTGNKVVQNGTLWDPTTEPNFQLTATSPARNMGIDLSQSWTINGVTNPALPGMTPGYFSGTQPDAGAIQFSPTAPSYTLNVQSTPITGVAIASTTGHGGTANYQVSAQSGANVILWAPPTDPSGYQFLQWTINGAAQPTGQKQAVFTLSAATTAVAVYQVATYYSLNVQSTPITGLAIGSTTGQSGTTNYQVSVESGVDVFLVAPATDPSGFQFVQWTINGMAQPAGQKQASFTLPAATTAVAVYQEVTVNYSLNVQSTPITGVVIGSTTGQGGTTNYSTTALSGAGITLTAPSSATSSGAAYNFTGWTINGVPQTAGLTSASLTLSANTTAVANYAIVTHSLAVQSSGVGGVSITGTPAAALGTTNYNSPALNDNTAVQLIAPASVVSGGTSYSFQYWQLNGAAQPAGVTTLSFHIAADTTAVAFYGLPVSVQSVPTGVAIQATPAAIGGTTNYVAIIGAGSPVTLTAPSSTTSNGAAYNFTGWTINGVPQTAGLTSVSLTISADTTAVANYAIVTHSLTVQSSGVGSVSITGTPAAASGTTNYSVPAINDNTSVTLTAPTLVISAGTSYTFQNWVLGGVAQPSGQTTVNFDIKADTTAVAVYAVTLRTLTVQATGAGLVSITGTPAAASGATNYTVQIADQTAVTLTAPATATTGGVTYLFQDWILGGVAQPNGERTIAFNINANMSAVATYSLAVFTVTSIPPGVTMTGTPAGVTTPYSSTVPVYSTINLTAPKTAVVGKDTFQFKQWILNSSPQTAGESDLNFSISADTLAEAVYTSSDATPPAVTDAVPAANSIQIPADSLVQLQITDAGSGVCLTGEEAGSVAQIPPVTIAINGSTIYDGSNETSPGLWDSTALAQRVTGKCYRIGTSADYAFTFQATAPFPVGQEVAVTVSASDNAGNAMTNSYSFSVVMRQFGMNVKVNSDAGPLAHNRPATTSSSAGTTAGDLWVAWDQAAAGGNTNIWVGQRLPGVIAFANSVSVDAGASNQVAPAVAFDASSGKLYVVWQDDAAGKWSIRGASSSDGGLTWPAQFTVAAVQGSNETNPALTVDAAGNVYAAWQDDSSGYQQIRVAVSSNGGAAWAATQVTTDASAHTNPAMTVDALGTAYVVWTDGRNVASGNGTNIYGADSAQAWTPVPLVTGPGNQSLPAIAADAAGNIMHLVWVNAATGQGNIYYAATTGGLAGAPFTGTNIVDDATGLLHTAPRIAVTGTGAAANVFVCWQDSRNVAASKSSTDIYYAESLAGAPFGTNILVNDNKGVAAQILPCIGVGPQGEPYMAWVDAREGPAEIWSADATVILPATSAYGGDSKAIGAAGGVVTVTGGSEVQPVTLDDVIVQIPPNAIPSGVTLTIGIEQVANPPAPPSGGFGINYNLSPSGVVFAKRVSVAIPYPPSEAAAFKTFNVYWYDEQTSTWSSSGITNVQHLVEVSAVSFETTHSSIFATSGVAGGAGNGGGAAGTSSGGGGGGGGGGWCFIATAAYDEDVTGSIGRLPARITKENLQRLNELRSFRDQVLLPTSTGKAFTAWYYAVSPVLAERIQENREAKLLVRRLFVNPLAGAVGDGN